MNKTPAMVLQELMIRKGGAYRSEFLERKDLTDLFRCEVTADDVVAIGTGRTKKDAKQNAAELVLKKLQNSGKYFPSPEDNCFSKKTKISESTSINSVGKLQDLCTEYSIPPPVYECLSETGPPHSKQFTMQCTVATIARTASATTKKLAKQLAAAKLLEFFQNNAPTRIADMEESYREISKMNELAMTTFTTMDTVWKPNLGQVIENYHLAFRKGLDEKTFNAMIEELKSDDPDEIAKAERIFGLVECEVAWSSPPSKEEVVVCASVARANPPVCLVSSGPDYETAKRKTASRLLEYVQCLLLQY